MEEKIAKFDELSSKEEAGTISEKESSELAVLTAEIESEEVFSKKSGNENPAKVTQIEGTLIKIIENQKSRFSDKTSVLLIVRTRKGLERFYINQNFWDKMDRDFQPFDRIMLSIEHRVVHSTTYKDDDGNIKVFGADAPKELWGAKSTNICSIDNVDSKAADIRKETKEKTDVFLSYSDEDLERLSKLGLRF
jgi:hypothetical protein